MLTSTISCSVSLIFLLTDVVYKCGANFIIKSYTWSNFSQALEDLKLSIKYIGSDSSSDTEPQTKREVMTPKFRITTKRKFDTSELCEIFLHKYVKYLNISLVIGYVSFSQWSAATISGSAWAMNIPFRYLGPVEKCNDEAFLHRILPTGGCLYAYYLCLGIFAIVVVTLSLLDLKEQVLFQFIFCILRFVVIIMIVVYCIVRLVQGGDACQDSPQVYINSNRSNDVDIVSTVLKFDITGWAAGTPVIMFGFFIHTSIPTISNPIKQKEYLHWLVLLVPAVAMFSFLSLIVATLWFRAAIQETMTLNWVSQEWHSQAGDHTGQIFSNSPSFLLLSTS